MKFLEYNQNDVYECVSNLTKNELNTFIEYMIDLFDIDKLHDSFKSFNRRSSLKKEDLVTFVTSALNIKSIRDKLTDRLISTKEIEYIYRLLIWTQNKIYTKYLPHNIQQYIKRLDNQDEFTTSALSLIDYEARTELLFYGSEGDYLALNYNIKELLKYLFYLPDGYYIEPIQDIKNTKYSYSNEDNILSFITAIDELIENDLLVYDLNSEKANAKSLTILQNSTSTQEFYTTKGMDKLAIDMLARAFGNYKHYTKRLFKSKELDILKDFVNTEFANKTNFFITRIFLSHLKKVRYDYYTSQESLFATLKEIIKKLSSTSYIEVDNIISHLKYNNTQIHIENNNKTNWYYMKIDTIDDDGNKIQDEINADNSSGYNAIFLEPIIKASFYYLSALGLCEILYDDPISPYTFSQEKKEYISVWDNLKYVKLTNLGDYIFGNTKSYTPKITTTKKTDLKFDEYKPIITLTSNDTIMIAKLENFCDKIDDNKYILSYNKVFKDTTNTKSLFMKIETFSEQISKDVPLVIKRFFDDIKKRANLVEKENNQIVLKLTNDKNLLELIMSEKKIKDMIIKAEGYRIVIHKDNLSKLKRILKENGYFME